MMLGGKQVRDQNADLVATGDQRLLYSMRIYDDKAIVFFEKTCRV